MLQSHSTSGMVGTLMAKPSPRGLTTANLIGDPATRAWSDSLESTSTGVDSEGDSAFMSGLKTAVTLAQVFGLLPVSKPTASKESVFRWRSFRVVYSFAVVTGAVFQSIFSILRVFDTGLNFYTSVNVIFYTTATATSLVFLRMGRTWKETFCSWNKLERHIVMYNGKPSRLHSNMRTVTIVVLVLALFEHVLSIASACSVVWPCWERGGLYLLVQGYYMTKYRKTFTTIRYSVFRAFLILAIQIIATFIWNFSDLFVILISMGLVAYFRQLNGALLVSKGQDLHKEYWKQKRETYNSIAVLTKTINDFVGPVILISYASNLYFICLQLLVVTKRPLQSSVYHDVYFFFSLIYLIIRTCLMSFVAANVSLESGTPRHVLFSAPSSTFCREAQRFLMQVNTDSIALTGCNFFAITRSFMLTVAGTIVTYIVILVQFDNDPDTAELGGERNRSVMCTCEDLMGYDC